MRVGPRRFLVTVVALTVGAALACDDPNEPPPPPGSIEIVVLTSGSDVITQDLRVTIGDTLVRHLDSLEVTVSGLAPGVYPVELEGASSNCQITGTNPKSITVESSQIAVVTFTLSCTARVGSVRVTTTTTGADADADGYTALVIGGPSQSVGINATITLSDVREGSQLVTLAGVASNCDIVGPDTSSVTVPFGATVDASFSVQCVQPGSLEVTVSTTGVELDPDGYLVTIQAPSVAFIENKTIEPNGSVTLSRLRPAADYRVALQQVAANCSTVGASAVTVTITGGATTSVAFDVVCAAPSMLAFVREGDIYAMRSDGTGAVRLTTDPGGDDDPAWSSAGKIAFTTNRHSNDPELYVMNADGTNPVRITVSFGADQDPSWSPDGQRLVFQSFRDVNAELYVANADGSGLVRLTNTTTAEYQPAWSSTGKIAFVSDRDGPHSDIYVMDADGSNVVRLTNDGEIKGDPAWSPDGSVIAFTRVVECTWYTCIRDIFVMNADGSNVRRVVTEYEPYYQDHADPAWSPNGQVIAFTRYQCDYYYCYSPSLRVASVHESDVRTITDSGANPVFRP